MAMDTGSRFVEIHDPFSVDAGGMKCEIGRKFISWRGEPTFGTAVGSLRERFFLPIPAQAGLRQSRLEGIDLHGATPERFGFAG